MSMPLPQSTLRAPLQLRSSITPGTTWTGTRIRQTESDGTHPDLVVTAPIRTGPISRGGFLVGTCDIGDKDDDGYYPITLTATATAAVPVRTLFIDIISYPADGDTSDSVILQQITVDVIPTVATYTPPGP